MIIFKAFGIELKRFTFLSEKDCINILTIFCPTFNDFIISKVDNKEKKKLVSKLTIRLNRYGKFDTIKHGTLKKTTMARLKYFVPKKTIYEYGITIKFLESDIEQVINHFPELSVYLKTNK